MRPWPTSLRKGFMAVVAVSRPFPMPTPCNFKGRALPEVEAVRRAEEVAVLIVIAGSSGLYPSGIKSYADSTQGQQGAAIIEEAGDP